MKDNVSFDPCQQEVIEARGGWHLVLAPPGCGKTQILTERIRRAHSEGVAYADMLCLTFTNRAARGMSERLASTIDDEGVKEVYVGNLHRFCSRFLFENNLVTADTSIIDDDDAVSIIARFTGDDEMVVAADYKQRRGYMEVVQVGALMHQIAHGHPRGLRLHPDCLQADDVRALRLLCEMQKVELTPAAMLDIYAHTDAYRTLAGGSSADFGEKTVVGRTLRKLSLAWEYEQYKAKNHLLDFEDLLLMVYDVLAGTGPDAAAFKRYPWIQVDEVQDLNPLQIALVELLATDPADTVMLLGDEQQAIFSFMGAKLSTLEQLKERCRGRVHHLDVNHRSRRYLLNVFNTYAEEVLHIDPDLLPKADNDQQAAAGDLTVLQSETVASELADVARRVKQLLEASSTDTTAVVVSSNSDADDVATTLREAHIPHFKVSGADLFAQPGMKLLLAHLNVLARPNDFLSWARLLSGLHVFEQSFAARNFVRASLNLAILPADHPRSDGGTYVNDFMKACGEGELVVFDTETTGLDVFHDDIVQIAAVKMSNGQIVPGSALSLFIRTERSIPEKLGDIDNPIIEELKHHELLEPAEALRRFVDYVGARPLLGHNADYDYHILDHNLRRYCPEIQLSSRCPVCFDSLRLIRLLEPDLKVYKLKALLAALGLEGENSHLADEDVNATCSLVAYCMAKALPLLPRQRAFLKEDRVVRRARVLRARYADSYDEARRRLYEQRPEGETPAMVDELQRFYKLITAEHHVEEVEGLRYVLNHLAADVIVTGEEPSLAEQLANHIMELNTMKEADLCNSRAMTERVFVSTVHKAKGLEFDNVIVFDAVDGRWPNFYSQNNPASLAEDARKFYVAITRATRRLVIAWSRNKTSYNGNARPQSLTRFMTPMLKMFN